VNAGNGFRPGTLPEASAGRFACRDICHVISGLDTTLADEAMADPRTILFCNDGSNVTRKALFKETAYCQAVWITILEVCPKTLPGFFASGMHQLCDLAPVSNAMRNSLQRAIRTLISPHPRRNGKKIFSLKCSNALHSRARKPLPGE